MSTITKEQLRERAREKVKSLEFAVTQTAFADSRAELEEELELARIALASLEAEAVCVIDQSNLDYLKSGSDADVWPASRTEMGDVLLYRSAPPAPVSVPTFDEWLEIRGNKPLGWVKDAMRESYEACRAAMLQGADGNSPVIPDGWVLVPIEPTPDMREAYHQAQAEYEDVDGLWSPDHQWQAMHAAAPEFREIVNSSTNNCRENAETSTKCWCHTCRPVTFADSHFVVCPECGNKRCPHANDHRNACTGSNEPGQEGSAYPAAPQQEVAQALAKGMERYGDAMQELAKKEVK
ncbi:hypothetical protein [Enterobacter asburiae]|uniref:hypothetical protein n=1 Tax=Enterobacter asburiae TaxID=61645 RepID=UPI0020764BB7|nr:hypothetical protein [Enterobacter asburiae]MCM7018258.1 hypothetical protein [Enterobacter asburiae]